MQRHHWRLGWIAAGQEEMGARCLVSHDIGSTLLVTIYASTISGSRLVMKAK